MDYRFLVQKLISISLVHRCRISKSAHKAGLYYGQPMILEFISENKNDIIAYFSAEYGLDQTLGIYSGTKRNER